MIRKLFFLLILLCLNCSCSMATLDAKSPDPSIKEAAEIPAAIVKENAALRRERRREMILARLERKDRNQ